MPKQTFFNLPDEKRQTILDLAIEEFAEHDYKNASISRIVARAGIAKGSFYQYFEDKKDLYLYLIDLSSQEKTNLLRRNPPPDDHMDVFSYIRWLLQSGVDFEFANPQLAQIAYRALYGDAPLPTETRQAMEDGALNYFRELIQQGVAQETLDPDLDPETGAFIFNAVFSNLGEYIMKRLEVAPERLRDEQADALLTPESAKIIDNVLQVLEHGMGRR